MQPQASEVFGAIARDMTVPKVSTTPQAPAPSSGSGAQVLTTNPANVRVEVLNGSGVSRIAGQTATALTSRGFDVTGTGEAANFAFTTSVIEYASPADMAAVNTLSKELTNVTSLRVATLTPGTVDLILGSSFTGLVPQAPQGGAIPAVQSSQPSSSASPSASASASASDVAGLAQATGGITAAAACNADSTAFGGPLSP